MVALIFLFVNLAASFFKSKSRLEAENAALRHQLTVLQRKVRGRVQFTTEGTSVVPENSIRRDWRGEAESAHHPMRCSRSSTCLQPS
jgi:hypothetical protein